ncbi:MAG: hypothetical protein PHE79_03485 [Eubacteriales bacterium]|nr:hypothetical protein [Eubacteriales bacterium]
MKKRIIFYIGWDIVFIAYIYVYSLIGIRMREYTNKTWDFTSSLWLQAVLLIILGGIIGWLVFVSSRYQFTIKLAFLELAMIGIPAFYLATILSMPCLICFIMGYQEIQYYTPWILIHSQIPVIIGSIVFGYELFSFIIRVVKCKQMKNPSDPD